jgi:hypothetical protein
VATRPEASAMLPKSTQPQEMAMARTIITWIVVPLAALVFAAAIAGGLGVIESITVTAFAIIAWSLVRRLVFGLTGEEEASDGARG